MSKATARKASMKNAVHKTAGVEGANADLDIHYF